MTKSPDADTSDTSDTGSPPEEIDPNSTTGYAAGIYGLVVAASVLAAGSGDKFRNVVALLVITLLVYWLAEQYAHILGHSLAGHRPARGSVLQGLREGWPMVQASYLPVGVIVLSWLLGTSVNTAVNLALTACVIVLFVLGWLGGHRRGLRLRGKVISAAIAGALGLAMVLLKLYVTH